MSLRFKPGGISEYFGPHERKEVYSSTCSHCQIITDFPSMRKMHEYVDICRGCMKLICLECAGKPCITWLKQCEIEEGLFRRHQRDKEWG
jgi:hypothetical protein